MNFRMGVAFIFVLFDEGLVCDIALSVYACAFVIIFNSIAQRCDLWPVVHGGGYGAH